MSASQFFDRNFSGLKYDFKRTFNDKNGLLTYSIKDPESEHANIFLFEFREGKWETDNILNQEIKSFFIKEINLNESR
jgi:hypothetical protein